MKDLSIGTRVRTTPAPIPGLRTPWAGLTGEVVGFPGAGNVRVRFDDGREVTCGPDDLTPDACEYFTRYGNEGMPGACGAAATLELVDSAADPPIRVCGDHAATIAGRYPTLGGIARFAKPDTLPNGMLPCPFCRSNEVNVGVSTGETHPRVVCGDCGARGPRASSDYNREAIANWNRRTGAAVTGKASAGLVGRTVMYKVKRGEVEAEEPCEVVACQAAGEYGSWHILVATHDGTLLSPGYTQLRLVADPDTGPYR